MRAFRVAWQRVTRVDVGGGEYKRTFDSASVQLIDDAVSVDRSDGGSDVRISDQW